MGVVLTSHGSEMKQTDRKKKKPKSDTDRNRKKKQKCVEICG